MKGCNVVKLDDDLPAGNYTVSYSFEYSTYYDNVEVTDVFTIHKRDAAVECSIEDIDYGKKPVLNLNCDNSLGGSVFYINSPYFENGYKFHIPKNPQGPISFELDENLTPRNYIVTFDYQGDHNHNRQLTNVTFKVRKLDSNLTVKAKDYILQGDNLSVEINANKAVNGNASCTLNDNTQTVQLVNGVGYATIDCHDLSLGKYVVSASFDGDTIFNKDNNSIDFNVKGYPNLSMHVDDSQGMFERLHVVVDADKNFSGNATITLKEKYFDPYHSFSAKDAKVVLNGKTLTSSNYTVSET